MREHGRAFPSRYLLLFSYGWLGTWAAMGYAESAGVHLAENGRCLVEIVRGSGDEHAARILADEFRKYAETVPVIEAAQAERISAPATIYVGTRESNPALAGAVETLGWKPEVEHLPAEGYLIRTGVLKGKNVIVLAGGDRTGAIYAASDLKNFYLDRSTGILSVNALNYTEVPKMPYRWFWNWDVRTNWDLLDHDNVYENWELYRVWEHPPESALSYSQRPFRKRPAAYLKNLKLCIDYMSEHKLNGLILWGFLRDNHGGIQAAQEICRYANERGVKIIPGVNLDRWYGGIYHEGNHEFNLETRAEKFPDLRAMDEAGNYVPRTLCAEKKENREWLLRAIKWLYETFPIGGVNLEFGENQVCYTPDCVAAREAQVGNDNRYFKDLARIMAFVIPEIHARVPQTWISYTTYGPFTAEMQSDPPLHIRALPPYAICQWTLTRMLANLVPRSGRTSEIWPEGLRPPGKEYIGYLHWNAYYTGNQKGFFVDQYREAARKAYRHGFKGLPTYGEESADFPNMELSYLAFSEFSYNPEMTDKDFLTRRVAPMYGGEQAGRLALEIARSIGPIRAGKTPDKLDEILSLAYSGRRISADYGKARWDRLIHFIQDIIPE